MPILNRPTITEALEALKDIAYFAGWLTLELTKLVILAVFSFVFVFIASALLS